MTVANGASIGMQAEEASRGYIALSITLVSALKSPWCRWRILFGFNAAKIQPSGSYGELWCEKRENILEGARHH